MYTHNQDEIYLYNNTFYQNTSPNLKNGGGSSSLFYKQNNERYELVFENSKFNNNVNYNTGSTYNNGGAFQYGFMYDCASVSISMLGCEFKQNKAPQGCGGALSFSIRYNLFISDCIFENNEAELSGAIHIYNQIESSGWSQDTSNMDSFKLVNCKFTGNKSPQGATINFYKPTTFSYSNVVFN